MKKIINFINEKLKVNSKSKVHNLKPLEAEEIVGPETPAKDYFGEDITIIGTAFKDENDKNYKETIKYIQKNHYKIWNDLGDIEDKDMYDWFVYAGNLEENNTLDCYVYGEEHGGIVGYGEK